jgi:hypothetical protein
MRSTVVSRWTSVLLQAGLLAGSIVYAAPEVKIGETLVTGLAQPGNTEFFGGKLLFSLWRLGVTVD